MFKKCIFENAYLILVNLIYKFVNTPFKACFPEHCLFHSTFIYLLNNEKKQIF